jgi:predicted RNA-binding protein with PIN domain
MNPVILGEIYSSCFFVIQIFNAVKPRFIIFKKNCNSLTKKFTLFIMQHILVDGYSIIHHWDEFRKYRGGNLPVARQLLIGILTQYHDYDKRPLTVVFDGRSLPKSGETIRTSIEVIFSKTNQTADAVIEQRVGQSPKPGSYLVATEDGAEQSIIESLGGRTMSADAFHSMIMADLKEISTELDKLSSRNRSFGRR